MSSSTSAERKHRAAADEALRRQAERLYRIGLGFCKNHADAQDLVQETMLRAHRYRDRFEGRSNINTWLYRIAARVCMRMRRRRAGQPARMDSIEEDPAFVEKNIVDIDALARRQSENPKDLERLQEAIAELPEPFRIVLVLKEIAGLSIEETASVLNLKPQTVKTRLHRARMRVRDKLVRRLPLKPGAPPAYSKRVCLDLLKAKQEALDRGVPFPVQDALLCERCRSVLATLDFSQELCRQLSTVPWPPALRKLISE